MSDLQAMAFGYSWTALVIVLVYGIRWRAVLRKLRAAIAKTTPPGLEGDSQKDANHG